jgi:tetratricopeptide (TPR) repeat protein
MMLDGKSAGTGAAPTPGTDDPAAGAIEAVLRALDAGRFADALAALVPSVIPRLDAPSHSRLRAQVLAAWGRTIEAARELERGAAAPANDSATIALKAAVDAARGRRREAAAHYRVLLERDPADRAASLGLAAALEALDERAEATHVLEGCTRYHPDDAVVLAGLGGLAYGTGRLADAEALCRRALALDAANLSGGINLSATLVALDRGDEALDVLAQVDAAAAAKGWTTDIFATAAIALCHVGRTGEAVALLRERLPAQPHLQGHLQFGPALLTVGSFDEGWRQYEFRWLTEPLASVRAHYGIPQWAGQPLAGETVLVRCEQGIGDVFQFVRYLPLLKARGATIHLQPLRDMDVVANRFPAVDRLIREGERLEDPAYFVNLMSLPLAFGTDEASIPAEARYLSPADSFAAKWAPRLPRTDKPKVAIAWAGRPEHRRDRQRSLRFEQLRPLLDVDGIAWVSMQKGPAAEQALGRVEGLDWDPVGIDSHELDDALAILDQVDLLVCVDTSLAHIAGALGKPVWVLLPHPADYRWLTGREDSPWYPTLRLFRQAEAGAWEPVLARTGVELARWRDRWRERRETDPWIGTRPAPSASAPAPRAYPGLARARETRAGHLEYFPDEPVIGAALEGYGEWMDAQVEAIARVLERGATLLEAGAGVGYQAVLLSRALGADAHVLAFEARGPHRVLLARNLAALGLPNATVLARRLGTPDEARSSTGVDTVDGLALERLDALRISEHVNATDVLAGAADTLWRCRPAIGVSSFDAGSIDAARAALDAYGYRFWRVDAPVFAQKNFNRRAAPLFVAPQVHALLALPEEVDLPSDPPGCTPWV